MATRRRFDVTSSASSTQSRVDALLDISDAAQKSMDDFRKGLISADQAMEEFAKSLRRSGRDAGMSVDDRQFEADAVEARLDAIARGLGTSGVTKDKVKTDAEERAEARLQLMKELDDALKKFRDGIITADEAARRQASSLDKLGEKANMTVEGREAERKAGLGDLQVEADAQGKDGPEDPKNPLKSRFGRAFGKMFGKGATGLGEKLGGLMGSWQPQGGILGNILGKNGLLSAVGGGAGAGPIAGPLAIAQAASKVMAGVYDTASKGVKTLGDTASKVAKNDGLGALTGVGDAIGDMAAKVPIVGEALQAQINMYTQFLKTFEQVTDAFAQRGKELKGYSGPIAQADAEGRVMKVMADLREAQHLGNDYAQVIREQAVMQTEMQRALEPIKHEIMRNLIPLMKAVNVNIKAIGMAVQFYTETKDKADKAVFDMILKTFPGLNDVMKVVGQAVDKFMNDGKEKNPALKYLMDFANADINVNNPWMGNPDPPQPLGIDLMK